MALAKALFAAAGLIRAATEHASFSSRSTATEHATDPADSTEDVTLRRLTEPPMSTSKLQASASEECDLAFEEEDLEKIVALLLWMAKEFQWSIGIEEMTCVALEAIIKHIDAARSVAKLSKLIDIMMLQRDGSAKDANATLKFMRRVAKIREALRARLAKIREELRATSSDNATERVASSDNATERVELDKDEVSLCYQRFGRLLLTDDLLPHQKQDEKYRLRNKFEGDTSLSNFQRSFTDNLLRKFLGDKRVAFLIWQHGIR